MIYRCKKVWHSNDAVTITTFRRAITTFPCRSHWCSHSKCVRSQAEILCFKLYRASDNLYGGSIFEYFLIFYNRPITASLRIFKHTIEKANFMAGSILCDKRFSFFMNEIERLKERS